MKKTLILFILFSISAQAQVCVNAWKEENKANPILEACRLEWDKGGVELVKLTKGCAHSEPEAQECYILRSCGVEKEMGVSPFLKKIPLSAYCLSGKEDEVMRSSLKTLKVLVTCAGVKKPANVKLMNQDKKLTKLCPFPFSKAQ